MSDAIENLLGIKVDLDMSEIPVTVQSDLGPRTVSAAAYIPGLPGQRPAHLVVFYRGIKHRDDTLNQAIGHGLLVASGAKHWAVALLVHDEDEQRSFLWRGDYDLTYAEAMAHFVRRIEKQI